MVDFDVFSVNPDEARRLLINYYEDIDFRWRWSHAQTTGIPVNALNYFARTGEIETRYIPILYREVFGDKSPEEIDLDLKKLERRV